MAYHLEYVPPPGARFDEVIEQDGIKVLIDSKALFSIIGSKMDWRDNRLSAGFVFDKWVKNLRLQASCGGLNVLYAYEGAVRTWWTRVDVARAVSTSYRNSHLWLIWLFLYQSMLDDCHRVAV